MLWALSRNVTVHRSTYIVHSHFSVRFVSTISSEKSTPSSKAPSTQPLVPRKVKLDLRPGPIKPKNSPSAFTLARTKSADPLPRPSSTPSLETVKEISKREIEDAEAHGVLVPPPPNASWFRKTIHKGIQLAKFYYRGVRLIFVRRKDVIAIKARIRTGGSPMTRFEYRLIATQRSDVRKVIPFIAIALLLEEIIPVIAIYLPTMLPSTCILPSQRGRIEEKKAEKATVFSTTCQPLFAQLRVLENPPGYLPLEALRQPGVSEVICGILRLPTIGIDTLRVRRIIRHLAFIAEDDRLLLHNKITLAESHLNEALAERGMLIQGLTLNDKQVLLEWWLDSVRDAELDLSPHHRLSLILERHLDNSAL